MLHVEKAVQFVTLFGQCVVERRCIRFSVSRAMCEEVIISKQPVDGPVRDTSLPAARLVSRLRLVSRGHERSGVWFRAFLGNCWPLLPTRASISGKSVRSYRRISSTSRRAEVSCGVKSADSYLERAIHPGEEIWLALHTERD